MMKPMTVGLPLRALPALRLTSSAPRSHLNQGRVARWGGYIPTARCKPKDSAPRLFNLR
jgi:hypothetical protein